MEAALARGHVVTIFNRGQTNPGLFPEVERLRGDRDSDLSGLAGREWDAVIDTSGYVPRVVRTSAEALADNVRHYTFISSLSVFSPPSKHGLTESDAVTTLTDKTSEDVQASYGPLKALCERAVEEVFPRRSLNLRPGILVGPHDPTNRFAYWVRRLARGGDVLAPSPPEQPVQLIDVRDFAARNVRMAELRQTGTFHATGEPISFAQMLDECDATVDREARRVWADEDFLLEQGIEPFADLPLWLATGQSEEWSGFFLIDVSKAVAHGLSFRPLCKTARDVLVSADEPTGVKFGVEIPPEGLDQRREDELLEAWKARA
ncbi:MAG TPA: NAD-dependent epimerase/dehydratase family protein [Gaiellaceae bacterium]